MDKYASRVVKIILGEKIVLKNVYSFAFFFNLRRGSQ